MSKMLAIDDSRMPLRLGSALRVPSYAYATWGIPEGMYRAESEAEYQIEWAGGSPRQMQYDIDSITRTGLGNFSQMLRDSAADAVVRLVAEKPGVRLNYFEPGAGVSTVMIYKRLLEASEDIGRVFGTLLEPSAQRLEAACAELKKLGLMAGKNYRPRVLKDTDALFAADPDSQDIIVSVAQIHHHSYLDEPMQALHAVTKPGGYIVITDWHNSMWEHPAMVYDFLRGFEWETKEKDLAEFARVFPEALQKTPAEASAKDSAANNMIRRFWRDGWAKVRAEAIAAGTFQPEDDIIMLEGHRPVERYEEEMAKAGYQLDAGFTPNPLQILPDSGILNRIIGRKPR